MCGFAGIYSNGLLNEALLRTMTHCLTHRGPDAEGVWIGEGIGLGHRRLSILDLSEAGAQPMASSTGRYVIAFNGEIYNHLALREALSQDWRGHSDTETILALIEANGVEGALQLCVGMFAFALWDRQKETLTLARDRFGEKPLYYGFAGSDFIFGSELKALRSHPKFDESLSPEAMHHFMRYSYVPAPFSIYEGAYKLLPAHYVTLTRDDIGAKRLPQARAYWSLPAQIAAGKQHPFLGDEREAKAAFEDHLFDAVKGQMLSDVPLGCFLSGGIDSSVIAAAMQAQSLQPVKSFSIGFHDGTFNEAPFAKEVAQHLGLDHHELYVSEQDALSVIPQLPHIYCEPFADASQIPTYLVSHLAKQHITVALSGDGGDEIMGGYRRYFWAQQMAQYQAILPAPMRAVFGRMIGAIPPSFLEAATAMIPRLGTISDRATKAQKFARMMASPNFEELYSGLVSQWQKPASALLSKETYAKDGPDLANLNLSPVEWMMANDSLSYLPDDILVKVDRAAMANSLEGRIPLLDHRLVEFAWQLPLGLKIRGNQGKYLMRQWLYDHVPQALIERPKAGFAIPLAKWLRGDLRDWAEALLSEKNLREGGVFDVTELRKVWHQHLTGQQDAHYQLWGPLMFLAWQVEVTR